MVVKYQLKCYCNGSYTSLTNRQLKKMVKDYIPACIEKFLNLAENDKEKNSNKIINAIKRSAIAEHLVNDRS